MTPLPVPGDHLDRFIVERKVGAGGMGAVFRARDRETGAPVALKVLALSGAPHARERFEREANALAELPHPHIVAHVAHGVSAAGLHYLAMEWLDGEDLACLLARRRLDLDGCLALLTCAARALAEAHRRGVVHRDIKPSNLFLRGGAPGDVVVLDFGIARHSLGGGSLTLTGAVVGTPAYMAPEQARGEPTLGPPADIFSLGCVLYECLTGRAPFGGEHVAAILVQVLYEEPPPVESLRPDVPQGIARLLAGMLAKDPHHRYSDGQALLDAVLGLSPLHSPTAPTLAATPPNVLLPAREQQIFSVAVATPATGEAAIPAGVHETLERALGDMGVKAVFLADGSLVATVLPSASAADQALLAARCGLVMRRHLRGAKVAVATGRGVLHSRMPIGQAVERALGILRGEPHQAAGARARELSDSSETRMARGDERSGVFLDELSESLLSGSMRIVRSGARAELLGETEPTTGEEARHLLGRPTPCVGRDHELSTLEAALAACVEDSMARAIGVVAPPGMGKSRLRMELLRRAARRYPDLTVLHGRGDPLRAGVPYSILGQAVRRLCDFAEDTPSSIREQRLRARAARALGPSSSPEAALRVAAFLGEMCGAPSSADGDPALRAAHADPQVMRDHVAESFLAWLRGECQSPVLLIVEDLHWGDALTVQLLEQALTELSELPLFVLVLARPEVQGQFPSFWSSRFLQELPLRGLSRRASERLVEEVLRSKGAVSSETVARIVAQAGGHPLFLEELIRAVAERREDTLPETVVAMLVARLSQLDPQARHLLRAGAVFGETFSAAGALSLLGAGAGGRGTEQAFAVLVQGELLERLRSAQSSDREVYRFRHALVRDAAYSLFAEEDRELAHRLAGQHLERCQDQPAVLAEHAEKARDPERAARFFIEAARQALASFDPAATARHVERALACGVADADMGTVRGLEAWARWSGLDIVTGYERALVAVDMLPPGSLDWIRSIMICFYSFFMLGRVEHAGRLIEAFMAVAPEPSARAAYLQAGEALMVFYCNTGMRRPASLLGRNLHREAEAIGPRERAYLLLAESLRKHALEPDPAGALLDARGALHLATSAGDRNAQFFAHFYEGFACGAVGLEAEAVGALRAASDLAARTRQSFNRVIADLHVGIALARSDGAAGLEEALAIGRRYAGAPMGPAIRGASHLILALAHRAAGERGEALAAARISREAFSAMLPYRLDVTSLLVVLLLEQGHIEEARAAAEEGLRLVGEQGAMGYAEVPLLRAASLAREASGDVDGAARALREARVQVELRASRIEDPEIRRSYLSMPENRRILASSALRTELRRS